VSTLPLPTYTIQAGDSPPLPLPATVDGYVADGTIETFEVRVFGGGQASRAGIGAAMNACDLGYWVARWRTLGTRPILATPAYVDAFSDSYTTGVVSLLLSDLEDFGAQTGSSGYLTGYRCEEPVFAYPPSIDAGSELTDVVVELQRYRPGVDTSDTPIPGPLIGEPTQPPDPVTCDVYSQNYDLPFWPCSSGFTVGFIQQQLESLGYDVTRDDNYGPGTVAAVVAFQVDNGLIPDGIVGARTWWLLMQDAGLAGNDLDSNGYLTPDELYFD
jgi:Putative peptidoglycan binding domain